MAAREATWLRLLLTELGLLRPDQQFAEIRVHESNKYVDVILRPAEQYRRPDNGEEITYKQESLPQIGVIPDLPDTI